MKMKVLLTFVFLLLLILDVLLKMEYLVIAFVLSFPLIFFAYTRDKANTLRLTLLVLGFLPWLPSFLSPLFLLASLIFNDEWLRSIWNWRLIVFSGIDGSGKSTHAKATVKWLRSIGINATYYHFFQHPLVSALSKAKCRVMKVKPEEVSTHMPGFREHLRRHILPKLRPLAQYVDNWIFIGGRLLLDMLRGRWVIADRYFYDFLIRFKCLGYPVPFLLEKLYLHLIPHPHLLVVFDISPEISFQRRRSEHPLWYYVRARRAYWWLAKCLKAPILNTERDFNKVQNELERMIYDKLIDKRNIPSLSKSSGEYHDTHRSAPS